jgi:hypothetical protein
VERYGKLIVQLIEQTPLNEEAVRTTMPTQNSFRNAITKLKCNCVN